MYAKNAWKKYSGEKLNELMAFNEEYKDYITKGKTERLCVKEAVKLAEEKGFKNLKEFKSLKEGDKVYAVNKDKNIAAFVIGKKPIEDGLRILTEELKRYEKVIYFSAQNINSLMHRYNIVESKDVSFKIINFRDVLKNSDFFNKKTKYDFSLKTIYEELFPSESIFEHSRIILNATSDNELERILVGKDMEDENRYLQKMYNRLLR